MPRRKRASCCSAKAEPGRVTGSRRVACLLTASLPVWIFLAATLWPVGLAMPRLGWWLHRPCAMRVLTGVPCPFCGATRGTILASQGEWLASLALNPLGIVLWVGGPAAGLWLLFCGLMGRDIGLSATGRFLKRIGAGALFLGALTGLWAYKIFVDCGLGIAG